MVVVDSHLHWRVGSSVWPPRCQQEISLKRNCSQKLISISKILGLQKYRLFLHYLFYSERGKDHKIHLERNELCWINSQIKQWSKMFALVHDLFLKTVCKTPKYRRCQPELVSMASCRLSFWGCFFRGWGLGAGVCGEPHRVRADRTPGIDRQAKFSSRSVVFGHYFQWIMN